ncbi:MAG: hypothetical protein V2A73_16630, partial [Pseudomonadota bacterium]
DSTFFPGSSYTYSVAEISDPPTVSAISPAEVAPGTQNTLMRISGGGFSAGPAFAISFASPGLETRAATFISASEAWFELSVADDAVPGLKDVVVTNGDGVRGQAQGLLRVTKRDSILPDGGNGGDDGKDGGADDTDADTGSGDDVDAGGGIDAPNTNPNDQPSLAQDGFACSVRSGGHRSLGSAGGIEWLGSVLLLVLAGVLPRRTRTRAERQGRAG